MPGARLRVRFAGRLVDAFLLARLERSEHDGKLAWIERVVSAEPVLTPQIAELCRAVADRYAGTMSDVIPPGGAATPCPDRGRTAPTAQRDAAHRPRTRAGHWTHYRGAQPSEPRCATVGHLGRRGKPCPARTGPRGWPS